MDTKMPSDYSNLGGSSRLYYIIVRSDHPEAISHPKDRRGPEKNGSRKEHQKPLPLTGAKGVRKRRYGSRFDSLLPVTALKRVYRPVNL